MTYVLAFGLVFIGIQLGRVVDAIQDVRKALSDIRAALKAHTDYQATQRRLRP